MNSNASSRASLPQALQTVYGLRAQGVLSALDVELCLALKRRFATADALSLLTAALTSRAVQQGHVCLDLHALSSAPLLDEDERIVEFEHPSVEDWEARLRESPLCVGARSEEVV